MIHLQEYREEYRHRTGTVVEVTEIGICYQLGGMNWFSGSSESRGVYLSVRPVYLGRYWRNVPRPERWLQGFASPPWPALCEGGPRSGRGWSIPWCPRSWRCTPAETSAPPSSRPATCSKPLPRPERFFLALESFLSNLTRKEAELPGPPPWPSSPTPRRTSSCCRWPRGRGTAAGARLTLPATRCCARDRFRPCRARVPTRAQIKVGCAQTRGNEAQLTKKFSGLPYRRANSWSSTTSSRRSPDSHFETNDCGRPSWFATSTWVRLDCSRAWRSRSRNSR